MFNNPRKIIFSSIGIFFIFLITIFSYLQYSRHKKGPEIISINLEKFMTLDQEFVQIEAKIQNTQSVKINGRDIILNDKKSFKEILVFSPGLNIIEIVLIDPFKKERHYIYHIYSELLSENYSKTISEARNKLTKDNKPIELTENNQ